MAAHNGDIARIVAHPVFLLETRFMRLVDDDQPELCEWQVQGRAGADHHLRRAFANRAIGAPAFGRFERGMPQDGGGAEAFFEPVEEIFGQGDFGQQHQHLPPHAQGLRHRFEIGFRLARSRNAIEQERCEVALAHRSGEHVGDRLLLVAQIDLYEIRACGVVRPVAIHLDRFEDALIDQPAQDSFGHTCNARQFADIGLFAVQCVDGCLALGRHAFRQAAGEAIFGHRRRALQRSP